MSYNQIFGAGLGLMGLALLGACGDEDGEGGGACGKTGCGGEVAGDWQVSDVCGLDSLTESLEVEQCPDASIDASGITMTGPVSFEAGGAYTLMATIGGSMSMRWPASCLEANGVQLTCEQLDMAVMGAMGMDTDTGIASVSCSGSSSCNCKLEMEPRELNETGTYSVSGTSLTMTDSMGEVTLNEFCVSGSTLTLSSASEDAANMSLVLTKR